MANHSLSLILHDIRSAYNVGAIFRTADAAGVSNIYLTGFTPTPYDRFGRPVSMIAKTALGAQESVPWEAAASLEALLHRLRAAGLRIVALEQSPTSVDYKTYPYQTAPVALVLGNERGGVPPEILAQCDAVVEIPMRGVKESLNVAVAAGIVMARAAEL